MNKINQVTESKVIGSVIFVIIEYLLFTFLAIKIHTNFSSATQNYQFFQVASSNKVYSVIILVTVLLLLFMYLILIVSSKSASIYEYSKLSIIISTIQKWFYLIYILLLTVTLVILYVILMILPFGFLLAVFIVLPLSMYVFISITKVNKYQDLNHVNYKESNIDFRINIRKRFWILYCIAILLISVVILVLMLIFTPSTLDLFDIYYYVILEGISLMFLLTLFMLIDKPFRKIFSNKKSLSL